jgi:hypothetical protein
MAACREEFAIVHGLHDVTAMVRIVQEKEQRIG